MDQYKWLRPDKFNQEYVAEMPIEFIVNNLSSFSHMDLFYSGRAPQRSEIIRKHLDSGVDPMDFDPIRIEFYAKEHIIEIIDGIHRTQVFNERKIPNIKAKIYLSWSREKNFPPWMENTYSFFHDYKLWGGV